MTFIEPDADAAEEEQGIELRYSDDGVCSSVNAASAGAIRASAFGQAASISSTPAFPIGADLAQLPAPMLSKQRGLGVKGIKPYLDIGIQGWFIHHSILTGHDPQIHT